MKTHTYIHLNKGSYDMKQLKRRTKDLGTDYSSHCYCKIYELERREIYFQINEYQEVKPSHMHLSTYTKVHTPNKIHRYMYLQLMPHKEYLYLHYFKSRTGIDKLNRNVYSLNGDFPPIPITPW